MVLAAIAIFVTTLATWNSYASRQLRKDHDTVLTQQANRNRAEQEREYSRQMRDAFLAWRGGNATAAASSLEAARRAAGTMMEVPDFTHDYLARLVRHERLMIVCPAGAVTALAVSADGARLASGHADGTLAVWDRRTGIPLGSVKAHHGEVTHVAFAKGGTLLVTGGKSDDNSPVILGWSVAKDGAPGPAAGDLRALGKGVNCFAVSPDGTTVYAGGHNGLLMKRTLADIAPVVARAPGPGRPPVTQIAVSHDGKRVLIAEGDRVRYWGTNLRPDEVTDSPFGGEVSALAATAAGLAAIGFSSGHGVVTAPNCVSVPFPAGGRVHWIATTADGKVALSGPAGRVLIGPGIEQPTGDIGDIGAGAFSPDGQMLFTGSQDGVIRAWDADSDWRDRGSKVSASITAISVSSDGSQYVVVDARTLRTTM